MIIAPEPLLGTVPSTTKEPRIRAASCVAIFFAVACIALFVWAWNTMFYCELEWPPLVPMFAIAWAKTLPGQYLSLYKASLVCAAICLIFGVYARRTAAGKFAIVTVTVPFVLLGGLVMIVKRGEARWGREHPQYHQKPKKSSVALLDAERDGHRRRGLATRTMSLPSLHASHSLDRDAPISLVQATIGYVSMETTRR